MEESEFKPRVPNSDPNAESQTQTQMQNPNNYILLPLELPFPGAQVMTLAAVGFHPGSLYAGEVETEKAPPSLLSLCVLRLGEIYKLMPHTSYAPEEEPAPTCF